MRICTSVKNQTTYRNTSLSPRSPDSSWQKKGWVEDRHVPTFAGFCKKECLHEAQKEKKENRQPKGGMGHK